MGRIMTMVLALIGIGIFAIPAALLSSAFSDELVKERAALKIKLHDILADGNIDVEEMAYIRAESKRLHLTAAEIKQLLRQVQEENANKSDFAAMPIHTIAAKPELALEHYKSLLGQIRQLALLTDPVAFERTAKARDSLTGTEAAFWGQIQKANNSAAEPS
jgi:DNA-binding transcriptional MerR regulator